MKTNKNTLLIYALLVVVSIMIIVIIQMYMNINSIINILDTQSSINDYLINNNK